jgi:citrate lyase beta subunit
MGLLKKTLAGENYRITPWMYTPAIYLLNNEQFISDLLNTNPNLQLIFDLEDALMNAEDPDSEVHVKSKARELLIEKISTFQEHSHRLYLRTNAFHSPHLQADLKVLEKIKNFIRGVILSKCEKVEEIQTIQKFNLEAVPMIETKKGFKNLLPLVRHSNLFFRLGINDYLYNLGVFPIPLSPLENPQFNRLIKKMFKIAKRERRVYCPPIYTRLKDLENYKNILRYYLQQIRPQEAIGFTALNPKQLTAIRAVKQGQWKKIRPNYQEMSIQEKFEFAWHMVQTYENRQNKNLGVTKMKHRSDGQYVTYHYYKPSKEFLQTLMSEKPNLFKKLKQKLSL